MDKAVKWFVITILSPWNRACIPKLVLVTNDSFGGVLGSTLKLIAHVGENKRVIGG